MSGGRRNRAPTGPRVDLHAHSLYSDGEHTPAAVAAMARDAGLSAFALTDHDCLDGLEEFTAAADGFEAVCGVEVSARRNDTDVHLVGLFIAPGDALLRRRLADLAGARLERTRGMVDRLQGLGIPITEDLVARHSRKGTVGRPHVALALVELEAVGTVDEAFRRYLRPGCPGYVPKPGPAPAEGIAWIHDAGGVAVLAHPGPMHHDEWIPDLAADGLDGLEIWHPKHHPGQRKAYLMLARDLDLVPSGGSDYHGPSVGDALVGQEPVPPEILDRLRARRPRS